MKKVVLISILLILFSNFNFSQQWTFLTDDNNAKAEYTLDEAKSNNKDLTINFTLNAYRLKEITINNNVSYIVESPNGARILKAGAPDLPLYAQSVIIPDTGSMEVIINKVDFVEIQKIDIAPSKGNLLRTVNPDSVPYSFGSEYQQNSFFPTDIVYLRDPYILRDFRGQAIVVQPFQYNPVTKTLRIYTNIDFTVRATQGSGINEFHRNKALQSIDREFNEIYKRQFLNYGSSLKYTPLNDNPGRMLIISYSSFISAMQPFIEWKIMKGIPCEIVDVSTIGNNATSIKDYVTNYYNTNGLTYLLLVGDFAQVTSPTGNYSGVTGAKDNSYAYITGNDHYQEFFVGRFSAESVTDLQTQVTRSINYEKNPTTGTWLEGTLGIASSEGPGHNSEYDYQHIRNIMNDLMNYNYTTYYELYDGSQGGQDAPGNPTATNVSTIVNNGVGNIFYCGHGDDTYWVTTNFSNSNVNTLTNYNKLPFIYSVACVVGHFNVGTCFCEAWMRANKTNGPTGAIGIFGSTINQSWAPPMTAQDEMADILVESYTSNIKRTFAGIGINGCFKMNDVHADYNMTDTWTVFGDPSIVLRTKNPMNMTVSHPSSINTGTSNINVTCNVNGAYVSITLNNQILGTGYVSNGTANITLNPAPSNGGETLKVCVTAYNYIPYIGDILVAGTSTNPLNFTATSISQSQIDLSWSLNSSNNPVLLVYNTTNTFGTPTSGTTYNVGQTINGGGTIIYNGSNTTFSHTGLNSNTTYYYKIFSIMTGNTYSTGVTAQATTLPDPISGFSLDFEACADWSTDFTPWTSYDGDGKNTYQSSDCDFTGEGTAFGFMAFNPSLAGCFTTHGGQRCGVSICPVDATESNDWIISPQIQMRENGSISFWVYSPKPSTWGTETYDVLVSTTNNQPSSFTAIASNEEAPNQWTKKTYSLSAYNNQQIYIGIRHRATDKFMMMIDDILIDTGTVSSLITNPQNFTATAVSSTQIDLSWSLNSSNNPVLLVYNTTNTFGTPTSGTNYNVGQTIPGGGTVIYKGSNTSFAHTGLNPSTTYYYKLYSIGTSNTYSTGIIAQATTLSGPLSGFSLDFEACADWSTDFTPWTSYDGDGKNTYGSSDCDFTGEGTAFGFMAFNPSLAGCFTTHGGQRCGVSICPVDATESNDWIISPQIQMRENGSISFWVYSPKPSTWGTETYDVLVSTTNNQPSSFTAIASNEEAPNQWTKKTYSLSAYNNQQIYIGIRHRATDKFMMMIDDILIDTGTVSSVSPVASFTYTPTTICAGSQVQFINTSQNATSYSWSFPGGNPSTSTQTNPIVTFNTPGTYTITLTASNGNQNNTYSQLITVNQNPIININVSPSTNICYGNSVTLTATGATSYQWNNNLGTNNSITITPTSSTSYSVTGYSNGCTASATTYINVFSTPQAPTITIISNNPIILQSSATSGNQWYKDNNPIAGAVYQTHQVLENGIYYAKVTSNGCISDPSNSIQINSLNINNYDHDNITIYPSPAQDIIYIQTDKKILEVRLIDALGRMVANTDTYQLNLDNISNGVYHLVIKFDDDKIVLPVIIQK